MPHDSSAPRDRVRDHLSATARDMLDASFASLDLTDLGWVRAARAAPAELLLEHPDCHPARVVRVDRARRLLVASGGEPPRHVHDRADPEEHSVVGDWVLVDGEVAVARLPRDGVIARRDDTRSTEPRVLVANVQLVLVAEALHPDRSINAGRIARLAAIARAGGADVHVLLTHGDRVDHAPPADVGGIPALVTSIVDGRGVAELRTLLARGATATIVGASGSGKSSLVNALCGNTVQAVSETRASGTGRHTTSTSKLVPIPGGGLLADTPGVRLIGMHAQVSADSVLPADVAHMADDCRFSDCRHDGEPGCAVAAAIERGELHVDDLAAWRRLAREALREAARADSRARAELRAAHRSMGKAVTKARRRGEIVERRRS